VPVSLAESTPLVEAAAGVPKSRRFRARLIAGDIQGSSGYYPARMLAESASVFHAGLPVFLDHPSMTEASDRPERSVRDLAGKLTSNAVYERDGLYADIEVYPHMAPVIEAMAGDIGMSIRASGTVEASTQEGVRGPIVTSLVEAASVDFVTAAGAGGKVVALLESARRAEPEGFSEADRKLTITPLAEGRNIGAHMEARIHRDFTNHADGMYGDGRLTRPERIGLSKAIGKGLDAFTAHVEAEHPQLYKRDLWTDPAAASMTEARKLREAGPMTAGELSAALADAVREVYGGEDIYTWVRDNTADWVVFTVEDGTDCDLYQQAYTVNADTQEVTLTSEPTEVIARTTYEPAPPDPDETGDGEQLTENEPGTLPAYDKKEGIVPELTEDQKRQLAEAAKVRADLDAANALLAEAVADKNELDQTKQQLAEATAKVAESAAVADRVTELETKLAEAAAHNVRMENDRVARTLCAEALKTSDLPEFTHSRVTESVVRDLPVTDGVLDKALLAESITATISAEVAYVAKLAESSGAGTPRGLGGGTKSDAEPLSAGDFNTKIAESFQRLGMTSDAAKLAATGRR
jgi:hypothetical protein